MVDLLSFIGIFDAEMRLKERKEESGGREMRKTKNPRALRAFQDKQISRQAIKEVKNAKFA